MIIRYVWYALHDEKQLDVLPGQRLQQVSRRRVRALLGPKQEAASHASIIDRVVLRHANLVRDYDRAIKPNLD
jgi:hypothetical protein